MDEYDWLTYLRETTKRLQREWQESLGALDMSKFDEAEAEHARRVELVGKRMHALRFASGVKSDYTKDREELDAELG